MALCRGGSAATITNQLPQRSVALRSLPASLFLSPILILFSVSPELGQSLGDIVKDKAAQRAVNAADRAIEQGLDSTEDAIRCVATDPERPIPAPLPQPTEAQLGAPVHPGAIYQARISSGMSQGESYYWVFVTADPASKVAAFYKAKTGVTRTEMDGMYMFVLKKGANPYMPDHGFVIEPNKQLTAGPPKTAITFNRKKWRSPLMRKDESATRVHVRRTDAD